MSGPAPGQKHEFVWIASASTLRNVDDKIADADQVLGDADDNGELILSLLFGTPNGFVGDGLSMLKIKNTDLVQRTVTIPATKPCNQGHLHDIVHTVSPGGRVDIGPLDEGYEGDGGVVLVNVDDYSGLELEAFSLRG